MSEVYTTSRVRMLSSFTYQLSKNVLTPFIVLLLTFFLQFWWNILKLIFFFRRHNCFHLCIFCHHHSYVSISGGKALAKTPQFPIPGAMASLRSASSKSSSHHGGFGRLFRIAPQCQLLKDRRAPAPFTPNAPSLHISFRTPTPLPWVSPGGPPPTTSSSFRGRKQ